MILRTLRLHNFRAHVNTELDFGPKINLIYGRNGAGKTNILEAVHYLCLSKSFIASQDSYVLRKGSPFFELEGTFTGDQRPELRVRLVYKPDEGKRIFVNRAPLDRLADIVGQLPVVVLSPSDHALTDGGPDERRRFLDNTLSQAKPVYLDDLIKYRRTLKQRNALLYSLKRNSQRSAGAVLESWNAELVMLGSRLIASRLHFLDTFSNYLDRAYQLMETIEETPGLRYMSVARFRPGDSDDDIADAFRERLEQSRRREIELGRSLIGPHRDEIIFSLNDFEVRRYASQGQHRTFGMALKLAKFFFLREHLDETPLLLLDDVFGDLDTHRSEVILNLLQSNSVGQTLITAADRKNFDAVVSFNDSNHHSIHVVTGTVETEPV